jgi:hypothetical protein
MALQLKAPTRDWSCDPPYGGKQNAFEAGPDLARLIEHNKRLSDIVWSVSNTIHAFIGEADSLLNPVPETRSRAEAFIIEWTTLLKQSLNDCIHGSAERSI